jgi:hypothetical protein
MSGSARDSIPSNDAEFNIWFKNLCQTVTEKTSGPTPVWPHIPASEPIILNTALANWTAAYEPTLRPHTPAQTLAKSEARTAAEAVIRPFIGQWLMWKQVSDAEREDIGVHNKKPRRDHIPAPATVPELSPAAGHPRQILVPYRDAGSPHRGKPADVHGVEVRWAFLDAPPTDIERELTNSAFDTASPLTLRFEEADRGKRLYLAGRWEIEREGLKGDFGDILSAIVP